MNLIGLIIISIGLSMDAVAVSICKGLACEKIPLRHCALTGLYFGSFQALMPLTGYWLGSGFSDRITAVDHWIACILLTVIGARMLLDAKRADDALSASFSPSAMLPPAIATSIDALAVGAGFAFLDVQILPVVSLIGAVTFLLSCMGARIGSYFGSRFRSPAQISGGIILIFMGLKILISHLLHP